MSFVNSGNTCYLATALQCLFNSEHFVTNAHIHLKKTDPFVNCFLQVFNKWLANEQNIDASALYKCIRSEYTLFDNQQEHDAHEALEVIIDILSTRCIRSIKSMYDRSSPKDARRQWFSKPVNMMDETFRVQLEHTVRCEACSHTHVLYQCEYGLFEHSVQTDVCLDGYTCDRCKVVGKCLHTARVHHTPPCLILKSTVCNHPRLQIGSYKYHLIAVCKHHTSEHSCGHYLAVVKNRKDGQWYMKDDGQIRLLERVDHRTLCNHGCFFVFEI